MYKIYKNAKDNIKGKTLRMEMKCMIKQIAWDAFKKTGDIEPFLELKQFENTENNITDMTITPMGMSEKTNQINENGKDINQKPNIF